MSQIYSSPGVKYYDLPGMNEYFLLNNEEIDHFTSHLCEFGNVNNEINDFNDLVLIEDLGRRFTILKNGMYSFNSYIAYRNLEELSPPATPLPTNVDYYMILNRPPQFTELKICRSKKNNPAEDNVSMYNYINISFETYLKFGDVIKFIFVNNSDVGRTAIYHDRSSLTISKLL